MAQSLFRERKRGFLRMQLNQLRQFHEDPRVIAWWCAAFGPLLRWLTPDRRRILFAVAAILIGVREVVKTMRRAGDLSAPTDAFGFILVVIGLFGILWLCYRAAKNFTALPSVVRQHPQITLHLLFWCLLSVLWFTTPDSGLWRAVIVGIAVTFPLLIWRCGYLLLSGQRGRMEGTGFIDHQIYLWGKQTPYGKGLDYLSSREAKTQVELARSQLAGIKLLVLVVLWSGAMTVMKGIVYDGPGNELTQALGGFSLAIPRLKNLIGHETLVPVWLSWASIYCELIWQVLRRAVGGHAIIAVIRLFGFNIFRNTYKPLLAQSVLEFWNRYFYYFKELLNELFFMPTFTRYFRNRPRVRLFAAIFAAAFAGNMYFHILKANRMLVLGDFYSLWQVYHSRLLYTFLLALGLYVSMLRAQRRAGQPQAPGLARQIIRIAGVWTFFAVIYIWNVHPGIPILPRIQFFTHLFGLG